MLKLSLVFIAVLALAYADPSVPEPRPDQGWLDRHAGFVANTAANPGIPILFFGDSITDGWAGNGRDVWNQQIAPTGAVNYGIGGDQVQHVHWRILNGEIQGLNPKLVVIKIGTNNGGDSARAIADGIGAMINTLRAQLPNARILLLSVLPRTGEAQFLKIATINIYLSKFHNGNTIWYLNLYDHFGMDWGTVSTNLFTDGLHLTTGGYSLWWNVMAPWYLALLQ